MSGEARQPVSRDWGCVCEQKGGAVAERLDSEVRWKKKRAYTGSCELTDLRNAQTSSSNGQEIPTPTSYCTANNFLFFIFISVLKPEAPAPMSQGGSGGTWKDPSV